MKILMAYDTLYMLVIHICSGVRTGQDKFGIENIQSFIFHSAHIEMLFALVAGKVECIEDHFTTMSGRDITLQIFVEAHDIDKCAHAMQSLKNSMRWDEQVYGREYDLDLYILKPVTTGDAITTPVMKILMAYDTLYMLVIHICSGVRTGQDKFGIENVVRMIRTLLGTKLFHKGADLYFQRHDGQAVTCEHFVQAMEDASDKDLSHRAYRMCQRASILSELAGA
jgi:aminopeptidase N